MPARPLVGEDDQCVAHGPARARRDELGQGLDAVHAPVDDGEGTPHAGPPCSLPEGEVSGVGHGTFALAVAAGDIVLPQTIGGVPPVDVSRALVAAGRVGHVGLCGHLQALGQQQPGEEAVARFACAAE